MKYIIILILFSNSLFAQMCYCKCDSLNILNNKMYMQISIAEIYGIPDDAINELRFRKGILKMNEEKWIACLRKYKLKKV